ncbi:MAG TPA: GAF domain-containing protein [Ignavibacteriaceae bacterium]|nr:GAF domain-containing protein [Ignavibacteriaceae bacterium]
MAINKDPNLKEISSIRNIKNMEWLKEFPFKTELNLKYLVDYWEKDLQGSNKIRSALSKSVLEEVSKVPQFRESIRDLSIIEEHKDLLDILMSAIYPASQTEKQISASCIPFEFKAFYSSPQFKEILAPDGSFSMSSMNIDEKQALFGKVLSAYRMILKEFYRVNLEVKHPIIARMRERSTGLSCYYNILFDTMFVKPVNTGNLPKITDDDLKKMLNDPRNLKLWMELIPPENFEFHGFVTYTAVDINDQEIISSLKNDLIEKEAIFSPERIGNIEEKLKSLLRIPQLKLGLAAMPEDWRLMADLGKKIGSSFVLNDISGDDCNELQNSVYNKVYKDGKPVIIEDLEKCGYKTGIEKKILAKGIRNILIATLFYKDEPIGILELGSPNPGDINPLNAVKVKEILSLFAVAVKRSMEEFESEIQNIIKETCTAIHPVVEWKFRKAAVKLWMKKEEDKPYEMEPVVFENVYPLYALTDIRDSSENRNKAIQNDLAEHLNLSKKILKAADEFKPLPILKEMDFKINKFIKKIGLSLNSADEISINEFLQNEIEPAFEHIKSYNDDLNERITGYFISLDPLLHAFYFKRKEYEESVALINETISNYLDEAQLDAQQMYPHYFEKYKSDGVEHSIYIGNSLVEDKKFDLLYLRNLRLWQLMTMCGIARHLEELKKKLKAKLECSHLILVQNNPLSIRFRFDEKKFDVDGTYNLRYEIMKKRIDKALIKGTKERLTQPGKIAVIFSQPKEAKEYKRYFDYLDETGYIEEKIEELEIEDLQGVYGLKAFRIKVNMSLKDGGKIKPGEILKSVKQAENLVTNPA